MGGDIAPAAAPAVAVKSVTKLESKARQTQRPWLLRRLIVRCESQQAGKIGRGPLARPVRFGKPDVPIRGEAPDAAPALDSQSCLWAGPIAIEHKVVSSRRVDDKLTAREPAQHSAQERFGERA